MRNKIIAVNAVIVLIVGLLAFAIVRTQLAVETSSTDQLKRSAQRDAAGAAAQLQLDGLRAARWLAMKIWGKRAKCDACILAYGGEFPINSSKIDANVVQRCLNERQKVLRIAGF